MALTKSGPNFTDRAGSSQTITIEPISPETSTTTVFTGATYGGNPDTSPKVLPGVVDKQSLTFEVLAGSYRLLFDLASPSPQNSSVNLKQGTLLLCTVSVEDHTGSGMIRIVGTPPAARGGMR